MPGLPPSARLRSAADFAALRGGAGRMQARHFSVRWVTSPPTGARVGLAVSRKVSKRAVERNRIKRIARASFRLQRAQLPPIDVLLIARPSAAGQPNAVLHADLASVWRRLQALKPLPAPGTIGG